MWTRAPVAVGVRAQTSVQRGHHQRRRRTFPRHIGDDETDALLRQRQKIVVVAADELSGPAIAHIVE
jgi:hypothetical protein